LITVANSEPFSSSAIRSLTGVFALKNFAQFVSIAEIAPAPEEGSDELLGAELVLDGDEAGVLAGAEGLLDVPELLHPASARPTLSNTAVDTIPASRKCKGCIRAFCRRTRAVKS
jgi:hypothetical protein